MSVAARADFLARMAECLELERVDGDCRFRETEGWSSLRAFAMLVTMEQSFGREMRLDEFQRLETIGELAVACGLEQKGART